MRLTEFTEKMLLYRVDRTGRVGRIGATRQAVEVRNAYSGDLAGIVLADWKQIRVIDAEGGAIETCRGAVNIDVAVIETDRGASLIDHRRTDGGWRFSLRLSISALIN